jgi:hypothetical protein
MTFLVAGVGTFIVMRFHVDHTWVIPLYGDAMMSYGGFRGLWLSVK